MLMLEKKDQRALHDEANNVVPFLKPTCYSGQNEAYSACILEGQQKGCHAGVMGRLRRGGSCDHHLWGMVLGDGLCAHRDALCTVAGRWFMTVECTQLLADCL